MRKRGRPSLWPGNPEPGYAGLPRRPRPSRSAGNRPAPAVNPNGPGTARREGRQRSFRGLHRASDPDASASGSRRAPAPPGDPRRERNRAAGRKVRPARSPVWPGNRTGATPATGTLPGQVGQGPSGPSGRRSARGSRARGRIAWAEDARGVEWTSPAPDARRHEQPPRPLAEPWPGLWIQETITPARRSARALFSVSSYSRAGSESATIPAPAWTNARPPCTRTVRMAIAVSMDCPPYPR